MFPEELWSVKRSYDGHYIFLSLENGKAFFKLSTAKEYLQSQEVRRGAFQGAPIRIVAAANASVAFSLVTVEGDEQVAQKRRAVL